MLSYLYVVPLCALGYNNSPAAFHFLGLKHSRKRSKISSGLLSSFRSYFPASGQLALRSEAPQKGRKIGGKLKTVKYLRISQSELLTILSELAI